MSEHDDKCIIIGGGIAGLTAAMVLAKQGRSVTLIESAPEFGGKIATQTLNTDTGPVTVDCGPTVFTLKPIFEDIFAAVGLDFDDLVPTRALDILADHHWEDGNRHGNRYGASLTLYADTDRTADAIHQFSGGHDAQAFLALRRRARALFQALDASFMRAERASFGTILKKAPYAGLSVLALSSLHKSLYRVLSDMFDDPRLSQLFGRYATYCGGNPMKSMATLLLVIHAELAGVWTLKGGMRRLADVTAAEAQAAGATMIAGRRITDIGVAGGQVTHVTDDQGTVHKAAQILYAGPAATLPDLLPPAVRSRFRHCAVPASARSLSAVTMAAAFTTDDGAGSGPAGAGMTPHRADHLAHHTVLFSGDYGAEFNAISAGHAPADPTLYLCAPPLDPGNPDAAGGQRGLFIIANARADGEQRHYLQKERDLWTKNILSKLERNRMPIRLIAPPILTTPNTFARRYPGTGGALYGRAPHGTMAAFQRPALKTPLKGLYLAGGTAHPSAGLPMSALSAYTATTIMMRDWVSTGHRHPVATPGGISTLSPKTQ